MEDKRNGLFQMADYVFIVLFSKCTPKFIQNKSLFASIQKYSDSSLKDREEFCKSSPSKGYELFYDLTESAANKSYQNSMLSIQTFKVINQFANWVVYHRNGKMADKILDKLNSLTLD